MYTDFLVVNARNVCQLINDIAASSVPAFKEAGLEYICLNLEAVLHNRYVSFLSRMTCFGHQPIYVFLHTTGLLCCIT